MSKPDTWMPLYIGDYLQDTTRLSTEQHGAYLLLIMDYWTHGALPDDDEALANITRLTVVAWKKNRPSISRMFQIENGEWRHKRIDEELESARQFIAKQKANGAKGGRPKKTQDGSQKKPMGFDRDNPKPNPSESPSPSPTPLTPLSVAHASTPVDGIAPAASVCVRLKSECKMPDVNPGHPKLLALLDAGVSVDAIVSAGMDAKAKGKGFAYTLAIAEGRAADAANAAKIKVVQTANSFDETDYGKGVMAL